MSVAGWTKLKMDNLQLSTFEKLRIGEKRDIASS